MSPLRRTLTSAALMVGALLLTGCGTGSYSDEEPVVEAESVPSDPAASCAMLVAVPAGLAQQKAAELGCVEVNGAWVYQGDVSSGGAETADPALVADTWPGGGIGWNSATSYAGTEQRVCGPFAGSGNSDDDVFLNLGLDYPDPGRFQIVIWDIGGIEPVSYGATLCASGQITLYEGVAQIELYDPSVVEILG